MSVVPTLLALGCGPSPLPPLLPDLVTEEVCRLPSGVALVRLGDSVPTGPDPLTVGFCSDGDDWLSIRMLQDYYVYADVPVGPLTLVDPDGVEVSVESPFFDPLVPGAVYLDRLGIWTVRTPATQPRYHLSVEPFEPFTAEPDSSDAPLEIAFSAGGWRAPVGVRFDGADDVDWIAFDRPGVGLPFEVWGAFGGEDPTVVLHAPDGTVVDTVDALSTGLQHLSYWGPEAGLYLIEVRSRGAGGWGTLAIRTWDVDDAQNGVGEVEPNDDRADATPLAWLESGTYAYTSFHGAFETAGDEDGYLLQGVADRYLEVRCSNLGSLLEPVDPPPLVLEDPLGNELQLSQGRCGFPSTHIEADGELWMRLSSPEGIYGDNVRYSCVLDLMTDPGDPCVE